jgi:uncharacterized RDD family membrane protein YckC
VDLAEGESTIGRSRGCTVTLRDPSASRNHVLLTIKPGEVWARDLQSSNGTYLNGERMTTERPLQDGDRVTIGETDIVVRITAPESAQVGAPGVGATVRLDTVPVECPACGAELPLHAEFCARCGHRTGAVAAVSALDPPPAVLDPAPPPPPASAPALPPTPYVPPPLVAPPGPPPVPAATGVADYATAEELPEPSPPAPPPYAREPLATTGAEILPPIADHVFESPGPPPLAAGRAEAGSDRRAALAPTPPPMALADVPLPRPPAAYAPPASAVAAAPAASQRPAGFWIRVAANLIDAVWIAVVLLVVTLPFGGPRSDAGSLVASLVSLLLGIVVPILSWAVFGATPGKALLGLRVIGGQRRRGLGIVLAFLRLCGVMVSVVLFGLGFVMVAFTRDKRGLHDHLAGTAVVRR